MQANREIAEAYQANGTPSAVLIAASGKIASPLAWGAQAITQLIRSATSSGRLAVPAAARAVSAAGPSSQGKPGPAAGAAAPGLGWTDQPVPAERGGGSRVSQCRYRIESFNEKSRQARSTRRRGGTFRSTATRGPTP